MLSLLDTPDLRRCILASIIAGVCAPALSEGGAVKLYCARDLPGFADAEIQLSARGPHLVRVMFVRVRPSNGQADYALRDCLRTAVRLDASRDIHASAWYRDVESGYVKGPELLQPYGAETQLMYRAVGQKVALRKATSMLTPSSPGGDVR